MINVIRDFCWIWATYDGFTALISFLIFFNASSVICTLPTVFEDRTHAEPIYCSSSPRVTFCIFDSLLEIRCCLLKGTNAVFNWGHGKVDSMRTIKGADIFQELRYWFGRWDRFQGTSPSVAYIEWISSEHRPVGCTKETFSYRCSEVHLFQILQHISPHPLITSPIWCLSASIKNTTADEVMVTSYTRLQFTRLLSKILTYDGSPASMALSIM